MFTQTVQLGSPQGIKQPVLSVTPPPHTSPFVCSSDLYLILRLVFLIHGFTAQTQSAHRTITREEISLFAQEPGKGITCSLAILIEDVGSAIAQELVEQILSRMRSTSDLMEICLDRVNTRASRAVEGGHHYRQADTSTRLTWPRTHLTLYYDNHPLDLCVFVSAFPRRSDHGEVARTTEVEVVQCVWELLRRQSLVRKVARPVGAFAEHNLPLAQLLLGSLVVPDFVVRSTAEQTVGIQGPSPGFPQPHPCNPEGIHKPEVQGSESEPQQERNAFEFAPRTHSLWRKSLESRDECSHGPLAKVLRILNDTEWSSSVQRELMMCGRFVQDVAAANSHLHATPITTSTSVSYSRAMTKKISLSKVPLLTKAHLPASSHEISVGSPFPPCQTQRSPKGARPHTAWPEEEKLPGGNTHAERTQLGAASGLGYSDSDSRPHCTRRLDAEIAYPPDVDHCDVPQYILASGPFPHISHCSVYHPGRPECSSSMLPGMQQLANKAFGDQMPDCLPSQSRRAQRPADWEALSGDPTAPKKRSFWRTFLCCCCLR
ncbi:hypothetical protein BDV98DRAFT_191975 [Pterulicium gracile]|uniref:Uncharacterized protein n=1 Tax=Pterulicium gracile TaxID=1884261 RepID=A0A5C3QKV2_9AGAR|nr:hypothetical protein BDV98DRAFT_191975 [Pterula gracilis]